MVRHRTHVVVTFLMLLGCLMAVAGPGHADTVRSVDFDNLPDGTMVSDQYAAQGITFVESSDSTGLPVVVDDPAVAHSNPNYAESTCYACEFIPRSVRADFSTTVRAVSARVGTSCLDATVLVTGYDANGDVVDSDEVAVTRGALSPASITDPAGSDILYVRLSDDSEGCEIRFDSLQLTQPDAPPPPDLAVTLPVGTITVAPGLPVEVPVTVRRVNGSHGEVDMVWDDGTDVLSGTFTPDPLTGTGARTVLRVSARSDAPFTRTDRPGRATWVQAWPGTSTAGTTMREQVVRVRVVPTWTVSSPAEVEVPSCGHAEATVRVHRVAGWNDRVDLSVSGLPTGVGARLTPNSSPPNTTGSTSVHQMTLTAGAGATPGFAGVHVRGSAATGRGLLDTTWIEVTRGRILAIDVPRGGATPGSQVTIRSTGFCPGTSFTFGNPQSRVTPPASAYNADRTAVTVTVPRLAVTGNVVAHSGGEAFIGQPLAIRTFRGSRGFQFSNYLHQGTSYDQLRDVYGERDTNISLNFCWPFDCTWVTPVPSPLTLAFMGISDAALSGNGSCFGMAIASQRLARGRDALADYAPAGARDPWHLTGSTGPAAALHELISGWHTVQLSAEFISEWLRQSSGNDLQGPDVMRERIVAPIQRGDPVVMTLAHGGGGHAVVGYAARTHPDGSYEVDVYDPNLEFLRSENASDGLDHANRMSRSTLRVDAVGHWRLVGAFDQPWTGGLNQLVAVPFSRIPRDPTLPMTPEALVTMAIPIGDADDGTVVSPGARLMPSLSGDDSTPIYLVRKGKQVRYRSRGTKRRSFDFALVGPDFTSVIRNIDGRRGKTDVVGGSGKGGSIWVNPSVGGSDVVVELTRVESRRTGAQRSARIRLDGLGKRRVTAALARGRRGVTVRNRGAATTVRGTISWMGRRGRPAAIRIPRTVVRRGETLQVQPRKWGRLHDRSTRVRVRRKDGTVRTARTISPAGKRYVRRLHVKVRGKTKVRRIRVRTRTRKVPDGSRLVQQVVIRKGGKVVRKLRRSVDWRGGRSTWKRKVRLRNGRYRFRVVTTVVAVRQGTVDSHTRQRKFRRRLR